MSAKSVLGSSDVAAQFCCLAGDVISNWEFQRRLTERWEETEGVINSSRLRNFFFRINDSLVDCWFLSVARLHDPATTIGRQNLSVEYVLERGQFTEDVKGELNALAAKMASFSAKLKLPRNRLLAHNDLFQSLPSFHSENSAQATTKIKSTICGGLRPSSRSDAVKGRFCITRSPPTMSTLS